ncbi:hypothetical protein TNCV_2155111 [Trichonephila clavipes]|nr:hypothetical protein TNCV_2155111 [Trichonephila clavipes]
MVSVSSCKLNPYGITGVGICHEPMRQGGSCSSYVKMYYYDPQYEMCREFVYTGCDGNNNRFSSKAECERECGEVDIEGTLNGM